MTFDINDFEDPKIRIGKCYHEAAHAVFAYHSGLKVHDIYVTPAGEGNSDLDLPDDPNPVFAPELAAVLLAGEYAEWRFYGTHKPTTFEAFEHQVQADPPCFDIPRARKLLEHAASARDNPWGGVQECYQAAVHATVSSIALWWPQIKAVARYLEKADRLNAQAIANILKDLR